MKLKNLAVALVAAAVISAGTFSAIRLTDTKAYPISGETVASAEEPDVYKKPAKLSAVALSGEATGGTETDGETVEGNENVDPEQEFVDAVKNANAGDTIKLTSDITLTGDVIIDKSLTIDFNGCTLTHFGDNLQIDDRGKEANTAEVIFTDSSAEHKGKIIQTTAKKALTAIWARSAKSFVVENIAIESEDYGIYTSITSATQITVSNVTVSAVTYGLTVRSTGAVKAENCNISAGVAAVIGHGTSHGTDITLEKCNLISTGDSTAVYHPQDGQLTVIGGTIKGGTGIEMRGGNLTITGGTNITATITEYSAEPEGSGATVSGAAVAISQHTTNKEISVTIDDATLTGVKALVQVDTVNTTASRSEIDIDIKGGTFNGEISTGLVAGEVTTVNRETTKCTVTGGEFKLGNGKVLVVGTNGITTVDSTASDIVIVAKIGDIIYRDLQSAIEATANGETLQLLANVTESIVIPEGKQITLDLNGKNITNAAGNHTITNYGTLTITGKGTVDNISHQRGALLNYGTLTLNGGKYTRSLEDGKSNTWYVIKNYGKIEIDDKDNENVTVTAGGNFSSLIANGYYDTNDHTNNSEKVTSAEEVTILINGGNFSGGINTLKNDDYSKATITGGIFNNMTQFAILNWNFLTIENGTFTSSSEYGAVATGFNNKEFNNGNTVITGGTFNGKIAFMNGNPNGVTYAISGGEFTEMPDTKFLVGETVFVAGDNGKITAMDPQTATDKNGVVVILNGVGYKTLQSAIEAAAKNATTIKLLANVTESIVIAEEQEITLDLNEKNITNAVNKHTITNYGTLTITGKGTVDNISHQRGALLNYGTLTLNGGTYTRSLEDGKSNTWYVIKNYGKTEISEGVTVTARGNYSSLIANGYFDGKDYANNNGKVTSTEKATLHIKNGTFSGGINTIKNDDYSNALIEGGTFTNFTQFAVLNWNELTITGGVFNSEFGSVSTGRCDDEHDIGQTTITGGEFNGKITFMSGYSTGVTYAISGGKFSVMPDTKFLVDDMLFVETEGGFTAKLESEVGEQDGIVVILNKVGYKSLQAAINAAANGTTLQLLADVTENIEIVKDKTIILNLNGHKITNVDGHTITNYGTLTITGEGTVDNISHQRGALVNYGAAKLEGGTYTRSLEDGKYNTWYVIKNYGKTEIKTGVEVKAEGNFSSLIANGYFNTNDYNNNHGKVNADEATLVITGGTFSGGINTIKNDDYGIATISGGTFTNISQFAVLNWNELTITGGEFNASESALAAVATGYTDKGYNKGITTITGGTLNGGLAYMNGSSEGVTYNVSGGTYKVNSLKDYVDSLTLKAGYVAYIKLNAPATRAVQNGVTVTVDTVDEALKIKENIEIVAANCNESLEAKGFKINAAYKEVQHGDSYEIIDSAKYAEYAHGELQAYVETLISKYEYSEGGRAELDEICAAGLTAMEVYIAENDFAHIDGVLVTYKNEMDGVMTKYSYEKNLGSAKQEALADIKMFAINNGVSLEEESVAQAITALNEEISISKVIERKQAVIGAIEQIIADEAEKQAAEQAAQAAAQAELEAAKKDAIAQIKQAAADEESAVIVPTATYAAINAAADTAQVQEFLDNALAEIADIKAFRGQINGLVENGETVLTKIAELKAALPDDSEAIANLTAIATALGVKIDGVQEKVGALATSAEVAKLQQDLQKYIDGALDAAVSEITTMLNGKIENLSTALTALSGKLAEVNSGLTAAIEELKGKIDGIDEEIGKLSNDDVTKALAEIKSGIDEISAKVQSATTVEEEKTNAKASIDAVLEKLLGGQTKALAQAVTFAGEAASSKLSQADRDKLKAAYGADLAAKIEQYYNEAMAEVENATTTDEARAAANNFKIKVETAKMIDSIGGETGKTDEDGKSPVVLYVLGIAAMVLAVGALALSIVVMLKKNKNS